MSRDLSLKGVLPCRPAVLLGVMSTLMALTDPMDRALAETQTQTQTQIGVAFEEPAGKKVIIRSLDDMIAFWKAEDFWGDVDVTQQLTVPPVYSMKTSRKLDDQIKAKPVEVKKELFYRGAVPLILLSNDQILKQRQRLTDLQSKASLSDQEQTWLARMVQDYRLPGPPESPADWQAALDKVDSIPASLALGQAAYESAYGLSRFAIMGNSFFGVWTWGDKGLTPKEQRDGKGDYKVASYDTPYQSVVAYMLNLNSHAAYADFRALRAKLRADGKEVTGVALAAGLLNYSEKGEEYVKTLRDIITYNELQITDQAVLRTTEPIHLFEE
ncbi:glucosaminidase domain-containing protein [Rhodovibrionaceae bacterium A322]